MWLESIVKNCAGKELTILMVALNAKVCMDNTGHESIIGRYGLAERNENSGKLANLCTLTNIVISGTIFW